MIHNLDADRCHGQGRGQYHVHVEGFLNIFVSFITGIVVIF